MAELSRRLHRLVHTNYVHLNGHLFVVYTYGTTYFVSHDHLGSTRLLTDISGNNVECDDYLPFGEQLSYSGCSNTSTTTHKFTGKERDAETGLDNFGARYNSSTMGRFMSPDAISFSSPLNPQSLNLYAYVSNNPLSLTDPSGHAPHTPQENLTYQHQGDLDSFGVGSASLAESDSVGTEKIYQYLVTTADGTSEVVDIEATNGTDAQNAAQKIANAATDEVGSKDWLVDGTKGKYGPKTNKCNEFVADMIQSAGLPRPQVRYSGFKGWLVGLFGKTRDADASEWANPDVTIPGWSSPRPLSEARPGDVIAQQHQGAFGHSGIVVGYRQTASVNTVATSAGIITKNDWGFRPWGQNGEEPGDRAPVVRHYIGVPQ